MLRQWLYFLSSCLIVVMTFGLWVGSGPAWASEDTRTTDFPIKAWWPASAKYFDTDNNGRVLYYPSQQDTTGNGTGTVFDAGNVFWTAVSITWGNYDFWFYDDTHTILLLENQHVGTVLLVPSALPDDGVHPRTIPADSAFAFAAITLTTNLTTPQITFPDVDASPNAVGEILYDNTVAGLLDGAMCWFDDDSVRYFVDLAKLPVSDGHMVSYDATRDGFYMQEYNELTLEELEDYVGAMVTGNTETRITVTYQDDGGTLDFVVVDPALTCLRLTAYADSFDVNMDGEKIIKEMLIEAPDGINAEVEFLYIDPLVYPNGITLKKVAISLPADAAYSMVFEEWAGDPPVWQNDTETVTTAGTDAYMAIVEADIDDKNFDASDMLYLDIPATDVPRIKAIAIFVRD